jgi:hypothetical protein
MNKPLSALARRFPKLRGMEWAVLLVLVGVLGSLLFMDGSLFPAQKQTDDGLESRLAAILSSIDGAGYVEVMIYETPAQQTSSLFYANSAESSSALPPVGVIVVADGASDIRVRLELIRAVQTLMDLPAEAVEVFQRTTLPK